MTRNGWESAEEVHLPCWMHGPTWGQVVFYLHKESGMSKHRDRLVAFEEGTQGRPVFCTNEHLRWLDDLRESGKCNMFGARPLLNEEYPELTDDQAGAVLGYWMTSFGNESR
jgi:hypothetical protein